MALRVPRPDSVRPGIADACQSCKMATLSDKLLYFMFRLILGTSIEEEGGMETEIAKRVGAGWMNWKKCSGVLCDKRMAVKLKGKVYRTVVRPAMLNLGHDQTTGIKD